MPGNRYAQNDTVMLLSWPLKMESARRNGLELELVAALLQEDRVRGSPYIFTTLPGFKRDTCGHIQCVPWAERAD